jgi:hypothetical protein
MTFSDDELIYDISEYGYFVDVDNEFTCKMKEKTESIKKDFNHQEIPNRNDSNEHFKKINGHSIFSFNAFCYVAISILCFRIFINSFKKA